MGLSYRKQPVKAVISIVTGARALDTEYQNTTGRPILVIADIVCARAAVVSAKAAGIARCHDHTTLLTEDDVLWSGLGLKDNIEESIYAPVIFAVPNEYYYVIVSWVAGAGSTVAINHWIEVEL